MALNTALKLAIMTSPVRTQTVLAKKTGIHESRLSRIIQGHDDATDDEKIAIAKALRKPQTELFAEAAA
jgi:plasmid maintenance system antidote protein VapI